MGFLIKAVYFASLCKTFIKPIEVPLIPLNTYDSPTSLQKSQGVQRRISRGQSQMPGREHIIQNHSPISASHAKKTPQKRKTQPLKPAIGMYLTFT